MKRGFPIPIVLVLLVLGACGQAPSANTSPTASETATASPSASPSPTPTTSPSPTPTPAPSPSPTEAAWPPAGFSASGAAGGSGTSSVSVVAVRLGAHAGYDRFVIEFSGAVPSYTVTIQQGARFTLSPSGKTIQLDGTDGVVVTIQHVLNWTSYTGPTRLQLDSTYLRAGSLIQNFEGVQQWGLGIAGSPALRVFTLSAPARLVVDVTAH
ncbi:MAG TPA: hypothetical protein VET65_14170 [Candidatus Limnocylindrales bacterium]|nr:hypothetical protein [Candidatus Limnocylindrales bacterium]